MKPNWLLDWIVDSAIAFSLVFNVINIFNLISANDSIYLGLALFIVPAELMTGYTFTHRMRRKWKNKRTLKSPLVQDAIASLSSRPSYTPETAKSLILSLCRNLPPSICEPILISIVSSPVQSIAEQAALPQGKTSIGDITCINNARSPYLRCAIAPAIESCELCKDYCPIKPIKEL